MSLDENSLPRSNVQTIFKRTVPQAALNKDVKASLPHVASVFINFLVANATEIVSKTGRKTLTARDILHSLEAMEMGDLVPPLEQALLGTFLLSGFGVFDYKALQQAKKKAASGVKPADAATPAQTDNNDGDGGMEVDENDMIVDIVDDDDNDDDEDARGDQDDDATGIPKRALQSVDVAESASKRPRVDSDNPEEQEPHNTE
ncbi:hypothetical protein RI367_005804 [Sorochytrium milnesiophthora]